MRADATCVNCLYAQQYERVKGRGEEQKKTEYLCQVMRLIADGVQADVTAPVIYAQIQAAFDRVFGVETHYTQEKSYYNRLIMAQEDAVRERITRAKDPVEAAMCISRAANYIDFTVGGKVNEDLLGQLLLQAQEHPLDPVEYAHLKDDLKQARNLVYLTDNCGEVVLDKLVVEQLRAHYPEVNLTVLVRGMEAMNDATMDDARECGLCEAAKCVGNGTNATGTPLPDISPEARDLLYGADVLIAKGQGNFETLHGSGLNLYYLFLCKCDRFTDLFHVPRNTGMLVNERRVKD